MLKQPVSESGYTLEVASDPDTTPKDASAEAVVAAAVSSILAKQAAGAGERTDCRA